MTDEIAVVVEEQPVEIVVQVQQVGLPGPVDTTTAAALLAHIEDPSPHPAYDDAPDLTLLFENGLV